MHDKVLKVVGRWVWSDLEKRKKRKVFRDGNVWGKK
jgi:hypothetical protein